MKNSYQAAKSFTKSQNYVNDKSIMFCNRQTMVAALANKKLFRFKCLIQKIYFYKLLLTYTHRGIHK